MVKRNKSKGDLIKKINVEISPSCVGEHLLNIIKAALSSVPIGATISSLISDYIPSSRFRRLEEFTKQIAEDFKKLNDEINEKYIKTNEFAHIFQESFRGVAQNYHKEKMEAFRGILLNSAINQDYLQDEKEYFLSLVNNLSVLHLKILKFLAYPEEFLLENEISPDSIRGGFSRIFIIIMPNLPIQLIESAFGDLFQMGLINTDKSIFHTITSASGLMLVKNRVSQLGSNFLYFCKSPIE